MCKLISIGRELCALDSESDCVTHTAHSLMSWLQGHEPGPQGRADGWADGWARGAGTAGHLTLYIRNTFCHANTEKYSSSLYCIFWGEFRSGMNRNISLSFYFGAATPHSLRK